MTHANWYCLLHCSQLIGGTVESTLNQDDIFALISSNPTLLILDGLDEVPNKRRPRCDVKGLRCFSLSLFWENVDLQIVMSSRPQGYNGEFDRFQPLRWVINDLSQDDFKRYSADWLSERIKTKRSALRQKSGSSEAWLPMPFGVLRRHFCRRPSC